MHMITGEIKNKVDKIWENVWAAGLTNPLSVIEQITYLMFIRALDDQEINNIRSKTLLGADVELIFPCSDIGQVYGVGVILNLEMLMKSIILFLILYSPRLRL